MWVKTPCGGYVLPKALHSLHALSLSVSENQEEGNVTTHSTLTGMGSAVAWWLMPRTPDPEAGGSSPTRVKPCCVLEESTFTPEKTTGNTQEAVAPSQHD